MGYLPQDPPLNEAKTVKENVMEGVQHVYDALAEYDAITGEYTGFPSLEKLEYVNTTAVIGRMSEEQRTQLDQLDAAVESTG